MFDIRKAEELTSQLMYHHQDKTPFLALDLLATVSENTDCLDRKLGVKIIPFYVQ